MLLFCLYLYQQLPHYVPKATVGFTGGLHEPLARSIELSNPAKKPIVYEVRAPARARPPDQPVATWRARTWRALKTWRMRWPNTLVVNV